MSLHQFFKLSCSTLTGRLRFCWTWEQFSLQSCRKKYVNPREIKFNFAAVKHVWTIGVIERSLLSLKKYLNVYDRIKTRNWHNHVDSAAFDYNTTHHRTIGCPLSIRFHERQPRIGLELILQILELKNMTTTYDFTTQIQNDLNDRFAHVKDSTLKAYHQYRHYFDGKAAAYPLKKHSLC